MPKGKQKLKERLREIEKFKIAMEKSEYGVMDELIKENPNWVNIDLGNDIHPLLYAVMTNNAELVKYLVVKGADPNKQGQQNLTALLLALKTGQQGIAEWLIIHGAQLPKVTLHKKVIIAIFKLCTKHSQFHTINKLLKEQDFTVDLDIGENMYPLMYAVECNKLDVAKYLIEKNADINKVGYKGFTAFALAINDDHFEIARFLLKSGSDFKIMPDPHLPDVKMLLINAVRFGFVPLVEHLLEMGYDVDQKIETGETSLMFAAEGNDNQLLRLLLNHKKKPNVNAAGKSQCTAISYAFRNNNYENFKLLLDHGADIKKILPSSFNALEKAIMCGLDDEIILELIKRGLPINDRVTNENVPSLFFPACKIVSLRVIEALLSNGAIYLPESNSDYSPWVAAIFFGNSKVVDFLKETKISTVASIEFVTLNSIHEQMLRMIKRGYKSFYNAIRKTPPDYEKNNLDCFEDLLKVMLNKSKEEKIVDLPALLTELIREAIVTNNPKYLIPIFKVNKTVIDEKILADAFSIASYGEKTEAIYLINEHAKKVFNINFIDTPSSDSCDPVDQISLNINQPKTSIINSNQGNKKRKKKKNKNEKINGELNDNSSVPDKINISYENQQNSFSISEGLNTQSITNEEQRQVSMLPSLRSDDDIKHVTTEGDHLTFQNNNEQAVLRQNQQTPKEIVVKKNSTDYSNARIKSSKRSTSLGINASEIKLKWANDKITYFPELDVGVKLNEIPKPIVRELIGETNHCYFYAPPEAININGEQCNNKESYDVDSELFQLFKMALAEPRLEKSGGKKNHSSSGLRPLEITKKTPVLLCVDGAKAAAEFFGEYTCKSKEGKETRLWVAKIHCKNDDGSQGTLYIALPPLKVTDLHTQGDVKQFEATTLQFTITGTKRISQFIDLSSNGGQNSQVNEASFYKKKDLAKLGLEFRTSASKSDFKSVKSLLAKYPELLNSVSPTSGMSALHQAAKLNQQAMYEFLLSQGANAEAVDKFGKIPANYLPQSEHSEDLKPESYQ